MNAFLKNVWYVAGWADEVAPGQMLARQICGEHVVLFRDEAGQARALVDRCPHRFAPLSMGTLCDGGKSIQCGYHGLRFDGGGRCVHNPHGDGRIPAAAVVRAFPVVERWSLLWIWMGEPAQADAATIPPFPFLDPDHFVVGKDRMEIDANYVLESDNILDLSHTQYLHPGTLGSGTAGEGRTVVTQEGNTVWSRRFIRDEILPPFLYQAVGLPEGAPCDRWLDVRWDAPSLMYLQADMGLAGRPREESMQNSQVHLFTPATEAKTHYFYGMGMPKAIGPHAQEIVERNVGGLRPPFLHEDKPMVEAQQRAIGSGSFWALKPVLLDVDAPAVRARRVLEQMLAAEADAAAAGRDAS
jgi:vanillate O-demethylase monooxygenase subunit